jgi:capsular exopolysaccharide synthesis family protein
MLYTTVAFIFSLTFSLGLAILTDYMDNTMRSAEDVEKTLQTRTLASIPSVGIANRSRLLHLSGAFSVRGAFENRLLQLPDVLPKRNGQDTNQTPLLLADDADAWLNEVYRQLRTSILLSSPPGSLQTILVTASLPSEGKTTTAINTALSLARTGAKVLLIDADTRSPRVHLPFGFDNEEGLTTTLLNIPDEQEILSIIKVHESSQLSVLTSGPAESNFTELLGTERMAQVMTCLESKFDYIIIDSPPIAHFADGILISQMVDGVLLVVNSGKTPREVVRHAKQSLHDVGARIVGVVLNNVKILPFDYSYYPKYYTKPNGNGRGKSVETAPAAESLSLVVADHYRIDRQMLPYESGPADPRNG